MNAKQLKRCMAGLAIAMPLLSHSDDVLTSLNNVCRTAIDAHSDEVDSICRRVSFDISKLAPGSPEHIQSVMNLGDIKLLSNHYIDASPYYTAALALSDRRDKNSLETAKILETLAFTKLSYAKYADGKAYAERALAIRDKLGIGHAVEASKTRVMLGDLLSVLTDFPNAETAYVRARDDLAQSGPEARMDYLYAQRHLSELYELQHRYELAYDAYKRLLDIAEQEPKIMPTIARANEELGWICSELHKNDEASAFYRKAIEVLQMSGGDATAISSIELRLTSLQTSNSAP